MSEATLTWWLIGASLFIGYPSSPVAQVCVEDWCFTPTNAQIDVVPWDGWPPTVTVTLVDGTQQTAVPYPVFTG